MKNYRIMAKNRFYNEIKSAMDEREVETPYKKGLQLYFPDTDYTYPFKCDGYMEPSSGGRVFRLIIEYKLDELLDNRVCRSKVLTQVVWYLKKFEEAGRILPDVCLVGDRNECFAMHTNPLLKYLDYDADWGCAPSSAWSACPQMVMDMAADTGINPFVFKIDGDFDFKAVALKIQDLADHVKRYVRVTEHNMSKIFDYFRRNVLKGGAKMGGHDLVEVFMGVIGDKSNYYRHPSKPNTLVCKGREIHMDGDAFDSFFGYFDRNYTPQETMRMKGIADRLIEDTDRRNSGDFWTPTAFVDYAHRMIEKALGEDWKEKYVVWDNCCGSLNLTRDYRFKELYCSTLYRGELNIGADYNPEAAKFQFDFLNDPIVGKDSLTGAYDDKLPKGLKDALLEDKPIVFFLNPPYATACNQGGTSKEGVNDTVVRKMMIGDGLGAGAENLQHQFMYRIMKIKETFNLTDVHIALFSNPIYLTGGKQSAFLGAFCGEFRMIDGIMFNASNFADVSDKWGITFNIWETGESGDLNNFNHTCVELCEGEVVGNGVKTLYNANGLAKASEWVRKPIKGVAADVELPCMKNAIETKESDRAPLTNANAVGYFHNNANSVQYNAQYVGMYATPFASAHGVVVMPDNFDRCTALFAARKLIDKTWVNSKDEYLAPNENHPLYDEFVNDSIVYSLFHSASNQSSLRNVDYKGGKWDIRNEFFWMTAGEMGDLANSCGFSGTYIDARTADDRYVCKKLSSMNLSPEAAEVLAKASDIVRNTFKYRGMFDSMHPEYQILNWDCGWYQVKALAREYAKAEYGDFVKSFKALETKMRPMVYELGFLRK